MLYLTKNLEDLHLLFSTCVSLNISQSKLCWTNVLEKNRRYILCPTFISVCLTIFEITKEVTLWAETRNVLNVQTWHSKHNHDKQKTKTKIILYWPQTVDTLLYQNVPFKCKPYAFATLLTLNLALLYAQYRAQLSDGCGVYYQHSAWLEPQYIYKIVRHIEGQAVCSRSGVWGKVFRKFTPCNTLTH